MKVNTIQTSKIIPHEQTLTEILDSFVKLMKEKSILVITSKIVSICEGRVIRIGEVDKEKLIHEEADYYLPASRNKYNITLTIKKNLLVPAAGIDESNGNGYYILWPRDPQRTADVLRKYLQNRFSLKYVGVIITDSKSNPLRSGTTGISLAYSGFSPLNNYIGKADIFGRRLHSTKSNVVDAFASAAVVNMGEGKEQTPLALIEEVPFIKFKINNPSKKELQSFSINMADDLYRPLLENISWKKGKHHNTKKP